MYLCMTKIVSGQNVTITHGKALLKNDAEIPVKYQNNNSNTVSCLSWVSRADTPHKCSVRS